jgi:hypothetical protein
VLGAGSTRCVQCNVTLTDEPPEGVPASASEASRERQYATIFDHAFAFSLAGLCARCTSPQAAHATFLTGGQGPHACTVDHRSIQPWTECPICGDVAEPKLATGEVIGQTYGAGRLPITDRQRKRLEAIFAGWIAGFYRS